MNRAAHGGVRMISGLLGLLGLGCEATAEDGDWSVELEGLDAALISVAGTSGRDVWAVGGDTGDGKGALALRYDGEQWNRLETDFDGDLWWVHVLGERNVFMGGAGGTILRYDGERFERMGTPGGDVVFGIWGATETDLWAVGGVPEVGPGFVWRYDGTAWRDVSDSLPDEARGPNLYKVWGRAADDVWLVGMDGIAVHWDGNAFRAADSTTGRRLFTVHGSSEGEPGFVAVGGFGDAVIVERHGAGWRDATPAPSPLQLFGVFMSGADDGWAVGWEGTVARRDGSGWRAIDTGLGLDQALHAVWVDPEGGVWAAGGRSVDEALTDGVLIHRKGGDVP